MCRIAGIASLSKPIAEMQQDVEAMCNSLQHGGPDDSGIYADESYRIVLGHRRLSLIDLTAGGHQPMHYAEKRFTITFNGEIYNYPELKRELLALGATFRTNSDTEVIMAAYAVWGTASFARLNGMFAFALLDGATGDLFLVRDVVGIKPLYYSLRAGTLVFASEVRAFKQLAQKEEEHPHWPVYLMAYGHLPEPITTLKGVEPLPKGTFLRFNTKSGEKHLATFDFLRFIEGESSRSTILEKVRESLKESVRRHLLSDAPIGVFLSGGIDSSIVALLAGEEIGNRLNTLSIFFQEAGFSEKMYQEVVLQKLASTHHQQELKKEDFHYHLPQVIEAMDLPSCDGINTWFISKNAREAGLKAVLSGIGGDELFGGYPSFTRMAYAEKLQRLPASILKSSRYSRQKKYRRVAFLSLPGIRGQYLFLRGQFIPSSIAAYLDMAEAEVWRILEDEPGMPDIHHLTTGNRAGWMEFNLYMQNQLLRDADVMSMAHGLEIRVPLLDKEFVKLALSLQSGQKYVGSYGKQVLIDAFEDRLPPQVWRRKKMGFTFPFNDWMQDDEWVRSKMMSGSRASNEMMQKFSKGRVHWSALMTTLLLRTHHHETPRTFSYA